MLSILHEVNIKLTRYLLVHYALFLFLICIQSTLSNPRNHDVTRQCIGRGGLVLKKQSHTTGIIQQGRKGMLF